MYIRTLAVALSMAWFQALAFSPEVDLKGSEAVARGRCNHEGRTYICFILKKDGNLYLVPIDQKGAIIVYQVKELKGEYDEDEMTLLWQRGGV